MRGWLGVDVGTVSVKLALALPGDVADRLQASLPFATGYRTLRPQQNGELAIFVAPPRRAQGHPRETALDLVREVLKGLPPEQIAGITVTGAGADLVQETLGAQHCNPFQAAARAVTLLQPQARTVLEIGGERSRFLRLEPDPHSKQLGIFDYGTNGDCAAGTGAFLDQQAARLGFAVEQIAEIVSGAKRGAQVAGRCSVFAKSDMIHAQQKGFEPAEVLRGLCHAVATNFRAAVVKGREIKPPVLLIGGVAANAAVVAALHEAFELEEDVLTVPAGAVSFGAIGAALHARSAAKSAAPAGKLAALQGGSILQLARGRGHLPTTKPLSLERVRVLRDQEAAFEFPAERRVPVYLGMDIGSVGTKLVLLDEHGAVVHQIFTRTAGRPIEVVSRCLRELEEAVGWGVDIVGVGTTGSGRELIGELIGADNMVDEITAHKTGATFIGDTLIGCRPDTIFEIGGQDSKYIRLEPATSPAQPKARSLPIAQRNGNGAPKAGAAQRGVGGSANAARDAIVVDFTMNEACAAGTGSFLEERAQELGISIKDEFSKLALQSEAPTRLGERCTVFMERDVNTCLQRGATKADLLAGLALSIAQNYINRVVRGRPIGERVFFQGGTAFNDAVAAALSMVTGKEIIVPPYNALLGAIGAARLARERLQATGESTRFRGFDLGSVEYSLREFTCHACANQCEIQEFDVAGEKTFWGDKCSDRFHKQAKTPRRATIPDLVAHREKLLFADECAPPTDPRGTIGIPLAMYAFDMLPLWRRFWRDCGFAVTVSRPTNRRTVKLGLESVVAEPCFPLIVAHGHVADLIAQDVDYVYLPNVYSNEPADGDPAHASVCPWGQTLPFVLRQSRAFRHWAGRILCPTLRFAEGVGQVRDAHVRAARELGVPRKVALAAFEAGLQALQTFRNAYAQAGREAFEAVRRTNTPAVVLVGRPYNLHDGGVSLSIARKLREHYGVNILPVDALPIEGIEIDDINDNMYWAYGRRILAAARLVGQHDNLHIVYVTNFKCGPDSFIKGFIRPASEQPFLTLQFDGHSNDAGMLTRCEAYLDSKGILRWWRTCHSEAEESLSAGGRSSSPRCPTPLRD